MGRQADLRRVSRAALLVYVPSPSHALRSLFILGTLLFCSISTHAQFQSPFVFAANPSGPKSVSVYTRNDVTGVLTPVAGSPFPGRETVDFMALDFKGRFLFTANHGNSKISMFTIDPNTGALLEVPHSPFASTHTNTPVFLSPESSGQFLYAINFYSSNPNASSIESFQIDSTNLDLVPSSNGATDLPGLLLPCGAATHPSGKTFYAYVNNPTPSLPDVASFVLFNGSNGAFTSLTSGPHTIAQCLAVDPQGKLVAMSNGDGSLNTYTLNSDGTLGPFNGIFPTSRGPSYMTFDTFGRFLYVTTSPNPSAGPQVRIFSTTANSALLQEIPNSPLPSSFPATNLWTVDPTAPLIYADQVYQVDPQTGIPSSILSTSPLTSPAIFSQPPGSQPILGPIALLSSTSLSFGSLSIGQTSSAQTLKIASAGGQALSLNTLAITGTNSGDFAITGDTCHVPTALRPGSSCSALISFTPSAAGARSAALTITDNASPPTESVQLSGTGLTPAPAVTLIPGNLDFGTVTQGATTTKSISVANSGTATLHVNTVTLAGVNASDFSLSSGPACSAAIATGASCNATVTFVPLAPGLRSATVTLVDDARDSPQVVIITGNANPAFSAGAVPGSSTTASVSAGQTAQYQMQLTPGPGYTGTVSLTCGGVPLGATCQVPSSVPVANGTPAPFTVTVKTSGGAILPPSIPMRFPPFEGLRLLPIVVVALVFLTIVTNRRILQSTAHPKRLAWNAAFFAIVAYAAFGVGGCGAGTYGVASTAPPPIVTPAGTSTIVITPAAMSSSGQPLQLQPIQLSLTVK